MNTPDSERKGSVHGKPHSVPAPSPLRLTILVGVLVLVVGALVFDKVIAPPQVKAASDKLHESAHKHNGNGLKALQKTAGDNADSVTASGMLFSPDIQAILGMAPTKVEKHDLYTIEYYCWWGRIPRDGNYITVLYLGSPEKPHYSTHYVNMIPEDASIPGKLKYETKADQSVAAVKTSPGGAGMGGPGMTMPGGGPSGPSGGKGKGRPQNKGSEKKGDQKGTESGTKKADEPQASEASKVTSEPATERPTKGTAEKVEKTESAKESK